MLLLGKHIETNEMDSAIDLTLEISALRNILLLSSEFMEITNRQDAQLDNSRKGTGGRLFVKSAKP